MDVVCALATWWSVKGVSFAFVVLSASLSVLHLWFVTCCIPWTCSLTEMEGFEEYRIEYRRWVLMLLTIHYKLTGSYEVPYPTGGFASLLWGTSVISLQAE